MAERPKTAAEIAEENGELTLTDTYSIVDLSNRIDNLRPSIVEMQRRLSWIVGSVRLAFGSIGSETIDNELLSQLQEQLAKLDKEVLKIGDTLTADYDEM